jgi:hypothetical protein
MPKFVPWVTHHTHICQTETNDVFLSHKFKKHTKQELLYEEPVIKKWGTGIKISQKDGYLMYWHKWQMSYTHPVLSAASASRCLSNDLIASISSGVN